MKIEIDDKSGFCFGVVKAIEKVEAQLSDGGKVFSIGDIMHNDMEMTRLRALGLETITVSQMKHHPGETVLIRAHGEPPATYEIAKCHGVSLVDATCPVVAKLQNHVKDAFLQMEKQGGQVVIFGKKGHPEVIGLNGQIGNRGVIVENRFDLEEIDFSRDIYMLSQTTQSLELFGEIRKEIEQRSMANVIVKDTICRQVSNRFEHLRQFCASYDLVLFVSGADSSNGKALYENCRSVNKVCYKIESDDCIDPLWLEGVQTVGICGATSTPRWLMERVAEVVATMTTKK